MNRLMNYLILLFVSLFCLALAVTSFVSADNLADGLVTGRAFWTYLVVLLGSVCLLGYLTERKRLRITWVDGAWSLFIGWACLSCFSDGNALSGKCAFLLSLLVLWFILRLLFLFRPETRGFLTGLWLTVALLEAVSGMAQLYGFTYSHHALFNLTGTFFNPGPYSGFLAILLPWALHVALHNRKLTGHYAWLCVLVICVVLPAGRSRSAWIAALLGSAWVLIGYYKAAIISYVRQYPKRIAAMVLIGYYKAAIISYVRQYPKRIAAMLLAGVLLLAGGAYGMYHLKKDSADGRLLMWKVSAQIIRERQGLGVGVGHFPEAFAEAQASYLRHASSQEKWVAGCPEYAFNEYLQMAVESGIFPLLLFLMVGGGAFLLAVRTKQSGIAGALIAFAIFAFSSYPLQLPDFWILWVCLCALAIPTGYAAGNNWLPVQRLGMIGMAVCSLFVCTSAADRYKAYEQWNLLKMLHNNKAYEAATEGYVALYDILKQNPRYLFEAAQCLNHSERLEEGSQYLRQAVRYSSDPMIRYVLAKNEQEAGNYLEAERLLLHAIDILPERIYPYYLLANLYAEPDFYQPDKRQEMADSVWHKKPKVESQAIREMREKVKEWLNK